MTSDDLTFYGDFVSFFTISNFVRVNSVELNEAGLSATKMYPCRDFSFMSAKIIRIVVRNAQARRLNGRGCKMSAIVDILYAAICAWI